MGLWRVGSVVCVWFVDVLDDELLFYPVDGELLC